MAGTLTPLNFTKDWTNSTDFPTVETSEAKVREDLQRLHNETRDYLNDSLLPEVDAALAAAGANAAAYADVRLAAKQDRMGSVVITEPGSAVGPDWEKAGGIVNAAIAAVDRCMEPLQKSLELCIEAMEEDKTREDRHLIQDEIMQLYDQIDAICRETAYAGVYPLNGSLDPNYDYQEGDGLTLQIGPDSGDTLTLQIRKFDSNNPLAVRYLWVEESAAYAAEYAYPNIERGIQIAEAYRDGLLDYHRQIHRYGPVELTLTETEPGRYGCSGDLSLTAAARHLADGDIHVTAAEKAAWNRSLSWTGTQAQYNALRKYDENTTYYIVEASS